MSINVNEDELIISRRNKVIRSIKIDEVNSSTIQVTFKGNIIPVTKHRELRIVIDEIKKTIFIDEREVELLIPYVDGSITSSLQNSRTILLTEYREEGTYIKVVLKSTELSRYEKYIIN